MLKKEPIPYSLDCKPGVLPLKETGKTIAREWAHFYIWDRLICEIYDY